MASIYLDGASPFSPTASPLHADLRGLPPMLVQVGTREALLDDARRLVERARRSGIDVTLSEYPESRAHVGRDRTRDPGIVGRVSREAGTFIRKHLA